MKRFRLGRFEIKVLAKALALAALANSRKFGIPFNMDWLMAVFPSLSIQPFAIVEKKKRIVLPRVIVWQTNVFPMKLGNKDRRERNSLRINFRDREKL